ncbi:hypothetical protein N7532_010951 [Penicillium argentinense]|uniref:Uncharacterized protein n=1 Tax=Penicillium argentinense TaxID=1131581 RepID=A0A9W9EQV1_9EURO|nr:uncharacterized protein N7532_010951 [Penicillium argentinense]KAJ5086180.1 hypothetical protein N7532_010951 [Penicillium argentinense]
MASATPLKTRIIVSIDFGTTFGENPLTVTESLENTGQKVLTVLYNCKAKIQWCYQVQGVPEAIREIKLLLDDSDKYRYGPAKKSEEAIHELGKMVVQASRDFSSVLVDHA